MLAILGALSLVAGTALLRYAMIANQRPVKPAWTSNWLINGAMAPAVITLFAIGMILIIQFGLEFGMDTAAFAQALVAAAIVGCSFVIWRSWRPEVKATGPTPIEVAMDRTARPSVGPAPVGPAAPTAGAPAGAGRRPKKAA